MSRNPEKFGHGAVEGVAAPEAANNAAAQTAFIPTLTLGIPGSATMALFLGALMIHGIAPGPMVIVERPTLFWGLIASMWIGNLMLVILNLPLRSEEHTSELQSLMRISYAVFCLTKKNTHEQKQTHYTTPNTILLTNH